MSHTGVAGAKNATPIAKAGVTLERIASTGTSFKLILSGLGHWKNSMMDDGYRFGDNATFTQQLGVGK